MTWPRRIAIFGSVVAVAIVAWVAVVIVIHGIESLPADQLDAVKGIVSMIGAWLTGYAVGRPSS